MSQRKISYIIDEESEKRGGRSSNDALLMLRD
jgi:hypothetical protein